jgi:hypothetical protein
MIVRSMSRKEPSFGQLLAYVSRDVADQRFAIRHNLLAHDAPSLITEYETNAKLLPKRKNGVVMYHEILSITRAKTLSGDLQKEALRDIALDYIRARAPRCLVLGQLHDDHEDHLHYHLVISANPFGRAERHRLSRQDFRKIQVDLEARVLNHHPELQQSVAINRKAEAKVLSQKGIELERRTGRTPQKDTLVSALRAIFLSARDDADLFAKLTDAGLELYTRGKSVGVRDLDKGRNHRLATLGLASDYQSMRDRMAFTQSHSAQNVERPPPAAATTIEVRPVKTQHLEPQEPPVELINTLLQGIGAVADILSITTDTGTELEEPKKVSKVAIVGAPDQTAAVPPESDADRIAREHSEEMESIRDQQDADRHRQMDGPSLRR